MMGGVRSWCMSTGETGVLRYESTEWHMDEDVIMLCVLSDRFLFQLQRDRSQQNHIAGEEQVRLVLLTRNKV